MYSIHHYVIKFVSDLRQVGGFLRVLRFPPPIKTDRQDITETLSKVALDTIILTLIHNRSGQSHKEQFYKTPNLPFPCLIYMYQYQTWSVTCHFILDLLCHMIKRREDESQNFSYYHFISHWICYISSLNQNRHSPTSYLFYSIKR